MSLRHDLALLDHRRRLEADGPTLMGADLRALVRKATSGQSWIARWSSWLFGTEVHISRMSDTWLRTHADDCDKHPGP